MNKTLTGEEVLMIKRTNLIRDYKSETDGFKGKKYRIYAFGDEAFAVHEDDGFHEDFNNGNIKDVMITVTDEGWSLANHLPWDKAIAHKRRQVSYDAITVENIKVSAGTFESVS